jgi:hypothetical protein
MSHTKRIYNRKNHIRDFYHPWLQFCCGNCISHKDPTVSKRRRLAYKQDLRQAIRLENLPLPELDMQDPMAQIFDMWCDYVDSLQPEL